MDFALAVTEDGRVYAWGANDKGQLGLGDTRDRTRPELIAGSLAKHEVTQVSCGQEHAVAVTTSGVLLTWGGHPCPWGPSPLLSPLPSWYRT